MKRQFLLTRMLLLFALIVGSGSSVWGQSVLYSENFGDNGSSNTAFASYSGYSATTSMFTGTGTIASHYTGSGKVGKNSVSPSDYSGASGKSAAWYAASTGTHTTEVLTISGIKIAGYSELNLSFGMNMTNGASNTNTTTVSYKIDDGEFQTLSFTHPTSAGWNLKSGSISGTGNSLTIKFTMKTTGGFTTRYDDIKVTGVTSLPSSAATFATKTPEISYPATKTYSQEPTTADGYDGEITYSMTENTAGATINSETGLVTVTKGGTVTVKATAAAVAGQFTSSEDTYTLTVNDTRASAGLAWSAASADVNYGVDGNVFPTLTNPHGVSVTYSSSDTSAATIDESGVITLKDKTASTTISAIFAGNEDYKDQTVTYTLNVTEGPFVLQDGVFDFVKAASADPFKDYGSGMTLVSSGYTTAAKTWTAGNVTMVTSKDSGNGYRWWSADGTLRFYDGSKATFSVPDGYIITKIVTTGANFDSASPSGLSGATWTGASQVVELSATAGRNIKSITVSYTTANQSISISSAGWATYCSEYALDFTDVTGLTAYTASVDGTAVKFTKVTGKVPAKTGLLVGGTTTNVPVCASADPVVNLLEGVTKETVKDAESIYVLMIGDKGLGFYKNTNAFTVRANSAYLPATSVPSAESRSFISFDDETTGIEAINSNPETIKENAREYYNLNGQRVTTPTKGLYIVNGKKVIINK